ncbi:MAG: FHA domain-containing protein, partial [Polyangiaceae bacterium]|nr:FHA domain-containing protein [Polyangiaceae bacterium]
MAKLILATAEGHQAIELKPTNSLGRHPNNTIQLLDKIVSKEHCILEQRDGQFVLRDLGSLNGTYVNGDRVRGEVALQHGDEIALGSTRARYDDGSDGVVPLPPVGPGAAQVPSRPPQTQPYSSVPPPTEHAHDSAANRGGTRVDFLDAARPIGTQIGMQLKGFVPFDTIADPAQLRLDYERLRMSWELTREIGLERDLDRLLDKVLLALFKFTKADRGVILLREDDGSLRPRAARRRDGSEAPIPISSTILNHVIRERAGVVTHDASTDFASSKGKSMILNRISSAMVVPLLHLLHDDEKEVLGVLWLDSEALAQFQTKDLEVITSVAAQSAMFIENTILAKKVEQEIVLRDRFMRLVAPNVAEQMLSGKLEVKKGGQLVHELTVFNSDIRGFTAMSEGTPAETIVEMLNEYFELMVET